MNGISEASGMIMASAFISGISFIVLIVLLTLVIRANRQEQALEMWISREFSRVHEAMDSLRNQIYILQQQISSAGFLQQPGGRNAQGSQLSPTRQNNTSAQAFGKPQYSQYMPEAQTEKRRVDTPPSKERSHPMEVKLVTRLLNEAVNKGQPFDMEEIFLRATPRMNVIKLAPREDADDWSSAILLDSAGDKYYALADNTQAFLFPGGDRFPESPDPKVLFDGARADGRVFQLIKPGVLFRTSDGAWQLVEKGRAQTR